MTNLGFVFMRLVFKIRDIIRPRINVLTEAAIEPGATVLDYGCGPGGYILPLARLVGPSGRIHAQDVHPLAVRGVRRMAARNGLANVSAIESDGDTGLPDGDVDVVLLYDVFHLLARPDEVLGELHRVLKPGGTLSFSDHHMKDESIVKRVTEAGLFEPVATGRHTHTFARVG